jgi:hypothetical protein
MQRPQTTTAGAMAGRGVWRAPCLRGGYPVIIAITSAGEELASIALRPQLEPHVVKQQLEEMLQLCDPVTPGLALVARDGVSPDRSIALIAGVAAHETAPASPAPENVERGVYWARYTKGGRRLAYAVDSHGDVVEQVVVGDTCDEDAAIAHLWGILDADDLRPRLQLLQGGAE